MDFNPWIMLACLVLIMYFIYTSLKDLYSTIERLGLPGPKPVWIFGNVLEFKNKDVLSVFKQWKQQFGKLYGFYEGFRPGIVLNDPDFAREVLQTKFTMFHSRTSYRPFQYYPTGLQIIHEKDFETWKSNRGVVDKALNFTCNSKEVMEKLNKTSQKMLHRFDEATQTATEGFDVTEAAHLYTSETVLNLMLNFEEEEDLEAHRAAFYEYERHSNYAASTENEISGLARLFPSLTPILKLADGAHKKSHDTILQILRSFLQRKMGDQNNNKQKTDPHASVVSNLLNLKCLTRDTDGSLMRRPLVEDEIISHLLSFVSETFNTTSAMIQFMLYELACNESIQDKLYHEILETCGSNATLDHQDLKSLQYFDMVFNETYRLHPIAPGVAREAACDCTIKGHKVKKGMPVRVMTCTMYSDENLFPLPEKFDPERFTKENQSTRPSFSFMPFGLGPRMCPGVKLANMIVKAAVVSVVQQFKLTTCPQTQIPLRHALRPSLCPANGVFVSMTTRH